MPAAVSTKAVAKSMPRTMFMAPVVVLAVAFTAQSADTLPSIDATGAVTLPQRIVPWPKGVSEQARAAYLASMRNRLAQVAQARNAGDVPYEKVLPAALAYTQDQVRRQNARIQKLYPVDVRPTRSRVWRCRS